MIWIKPVDEKSSINGIRFVSQQQGFGSLKQPRSGSDFSLDFGYPEHEDWFWNQRTQSRNEATALLKALNRKPLPLYKLEDQVKSLLFMIPKKERQVWGPLQHHAPNNRLPQPLQMWQLVQLMETEGLVEVINRKKQIAIGRWVLWSKDLGLHYHLTERGRYYAQKSRHLF